VSSFTLPRRAQNEQTAVAGSPETPASIAVGSACEDRDCVLSRAWWTD
jgi:hypothetical protein